MRLLNSNLYFRGEGLFYDSDLLSCYILLHQYRMDFICAKIDGLPLRYLPMYCHCTVSYISDYLVSRRGKVKLRKV